MSNWYYLYDRGQCELQRLPHLAHAECLQLACYLPTSLGPDDIKAWRDASKPGDYFVLNSNLSLWNLSFELPTWATPGPYLLHNPAKYADDCK